MLSSFQSGRSSRASIGSARSMAAENFNLRSIVDDSKWIHRSHCPSLPAPHHAQARPHRLSSRACTGWQASGHLCQEADVAGKPRYSAARCAAARQSALCPADRDRDQRRRGEVTNAMGPSSAIWDDAKPLLSCQIGSHRPPSLAFGPPPDQHRSSRPRRWLRDGCSQGVATRYRDR